MRCLWARWFVSRSTPKASGSWTRFSARSSRKQSRVIKHAIEKTLFGAWRSLVAHWHGGPGVSSSNLLAPTTCVSSYDSTPTSEM